MLAALRVLDPEGGTLGLKWPNDLVAWREGRLVKLGGILGEQAAGRLILGLGVNLTAAPDLPDRAIPPACLADLGLAALPVASLSMAILQYWMDLREILQPAFFWPGPGDAIRWEEGEGTCLGWEPDGRLKVAGAGGIRRLSAGDLRGLETRDP
ncbi:MAG TPA: hypothetical protein VK150_07755, partial [Geothrix sp.]|nr:hypothetical protein [Geothrix sp.]